MIENTLIGAAFETRPPPHPILQGGFDPSLGDDGFRSPRLLKIRAARTAGLRESASTLINLRYGWRGYATVPLPKQDSVDRITLVATDEDTTIGTMTVGFGGAEGLLAEELFPDEVGELRAAGHKVCEFTKLAMDGTLGSKRVLASLFHVAYIYAFRVMGFDRLLIEVNPRHVNYYRKILGFTVMGPERMNSRVNAPAVLLCLDFEHMKEQIGKFGGRPQLSATERSIYPFLFPIDEEAGIAGRLKSAREITFSGGFRSRTPGHGATARHVV